MKVLYTGSFDPITKGHLDIVQRISCKFDEVVVAVFNNQQKNYWFSIEQRCDMVRDAIKHLEKLVFSDDRMSEEWMIHPGPDVQYQMNLEYLAELCNFMSEKYNREIV